VSTPDPVTAGLAALRGTLKQKPPNARTLAAIRANPACNARRILDAAGVDKAALAGTLGRPVPEEQSKIALQRGNRFERLVKDDNYGELIRLLRDAGYPVEQVLRVLPLRDIYPIDRRNPTIALGKRASETKTAIIAMAEGREDAYNLIDGGALQWDFGGAIARLEADGIAWRIGDRIRVVEIKSFPIVDGRADPEKVGGAVWQMAVYVAALVDLLEGEGFDSSVVSTEVLLVGAKNTGLVPIIKQVDVTAHVRTLRRMLERRATIPTILASLEPGVTLDTVGMNDDQASDHVADVLETLGTHYNSSCLSTCPLALHCRETARVSGSPACADLDIGSVRSIGRALELSQGAPPDSSEEDIAAQLLRAARLLATVGISPPAGSATHGGAARGAA
jgi:hypothetical protein